MEDIIQGANIYVLKGKNNTVHYIHPDQDLYRQSSIANELPDVKWIDIGDVILKDSKTWEHESREMLLNSICAPCLEPMGELILTIIKVVYETINKVKGILGWYEILFLISSTSSS